MNETLGQKMKPVVACVDGGDDGDRALRYAIEEAQRRQTGVRMVHVAPELVPFAPPSPLYVTPNLREIGARILKDALEHCHELAPDLYVEGTMAGGQRVHSIVEESQDAAAVVLGTREWRAYRHFEGATTGGVAARAHCPVISVPPTWQPGQRAGKVVVGVDEMAGPAVVLKHALEAARIRNAQLTIVHAWTPPHPYAPAFGSFEAYEWESSMEDWLDEVTAGTRAGYPDVETRLVASYGVDRGTIADVAIGADLLVVGRHRFETPLIHRLGSVAQRALHAGVCPVEVVPVHQARS
jgi:nucleotide-binding universal stress UspA family protein